MPAEIFDRTDLEHLQTDTQLLFNDAIEFSEYIESVAVKNEITVTNACIDYQETHDIEFPEIAKLLTASLRGKIELEMQESGLLPKTNQVEFED